MKFLASWTGAAALAAGMATMAPAAEQELKLAHVFNEDHPVHQGMVMAGELLEERTNGKYGLQIFASGTFANYKDAVQGVRFGTLDFAPLDTAIDYLPSSGVLLAPYTFRDYDHWASFKQSGVYDELLADISEAAGVQQLALYTFGFRSVTTKDAPATTPEEFEGVKLRVVNFPPYPEAATVLNATGTPLPIGDVYLALSSGVADGQENPFNQILSMKFHEVQNYLILTNHILTTSGIAMSDRAYDSLSEEEQGIFREVFAEAAAEIDRLVIEGEQEQFRELVEDHGMTPVEVDRTLFQARAPEILTRYPEFQDLYDAIQAIE